MACNDHNDILYRFTCWSVMQIHSVVERVTWNLSSAAFSARVAQLRLSCLASDHMTICNGGRLLTVRCALRLSVCICAAHAHSLPTKQ